MNRRITLRDKVGYSAASFGDAAEYSFISSFLLFFLTTVAGLPPAVAGAITVAASIWNAAISPIIGYMSDHSVNRLGRRRSFILFFSLPMAAATVLLFTGLHILFAAKVIYYGIMTMLFWTGYSGFFVPYYALGAEYTEDYDERTVLRSYASFFNLIGGGIAMTLPALLVKAFEMADLSEKAAWTLTAVIIAVVAEISILFTFGTSAHKDIPPERKDRERFRIRKMLGEYIEVMKLGPARIVMMTSVFSLIAYTIFISDLIYFLTYNMQYEGGQTSAALVFRFMVGLVLLPAAAWLSRMTDKKIAMSTIFIISVAGSVVMRIIGVDGVLHLVILLILIAMGTTVYWQIMPAITYDLCEYDEYINGERRQGTIVSIQGLVESIASGLGAQILGIILQFAGFDGTASIQTETACSWIFSCVTLVPAALLLLAVVVLFRYPITKEMYEDIHRKLRP